MMKNFLEILLAAKYVAVRNILLQTIGTKFSLLIVFPLNICFIVHAIVLDNKLACFLRNLLCQRLFCIQCKLS